MFQCFALSRALCGVKMDKKFVVELPKAIGFANFEKRLREIRQIIVNLKQFYVRKNYSAEIDHLTVKW